MIIAGLTGGSAAFVSTPSASAQVPGGGSGGSGGCGDEGCAGLQLTGDEVFVESGSNDTWFLSGDAVLPDRYGTPGGGKPEAVLRSCMSHLAQIMRDLHEPGPRVRRERGVRRVRCRGA